ncbi:hypothetical protein HF086_012466 [Spodoptera exigua]|uniref:THAP domain-containing protein 9 n=1 Tax=Spodoptera exigua TaxID=7107 RepID=A0A922M4I0_SPOEX|nr:hypothetical protein HF086_012466 [Spodoptera exigua]
MNESWKIPVAYFLVNGLSAETRANLLKTCLSECYRVGVDIIAITLDGCSSNINAATLLGCDLKQPSNLKTTFGHPECNLDVAIMFDPCHMVKLVRNSFESKRQFFDGSGRKIRWQSLENLVKLQKNVGLNFANKITPRHIYFRNQVMTVKLATQIMSMHVANALKLCDEILTSSLFVDTEGTVDFIEMLNHLFEIFNSKSSDLYGMKKPLSLKTANDIIVFLEIAKQYILNLYIFTKYRHKVGKKITIKIIKKKIVASKHKTGFLGFLVCIESLKHLYTTLIEGQRLQHIATHRFSQDHIEILFGAIRQHGVYNNNPSVMQFKGIFKKILQRLKTKSSFLGNCLSLEDTALTCSSGVDNINSTVSRRTMDEEIYSIESDSKSISTIENVIETNVAVFSAMLNQESVKTTTKQIVGYISGWVSRKLASVLKCSTCIDSLYSNNKLWFHKLIILKTMGGLCFSSEDVFQICLKSESIIKNYIKEMGHTSLPDHRDIQILKNRILKSFIGCNDVLSSLHQHSLEQHPTFDHRVQLIRAVIDKFIHVRLHFAHKTSESNYKRQKTNKLCLF